MDQVHVIRHKVLVEGRSVRGVARELGISRNTVRKYVAADAPVPPCRQEGARARPVLERVRKRIDELLELAKTEKQRPTGSKILDCLRAEGFEIGITTVRDYLRERRLSAKEVYVPLVYTAGDLAEVDFFEVTITVAGETQKAWMFVLRWMYSGRDFAWLYERCDQISFLDGHARAFLHAGCVPHRVVYDNLKPAVKRIVLGGARELQDRFEALCSYYLFEPCFARPGEGHDKGGVEARGKGIRLRHLWPIPEGRTLDEIRAALLERVERQAAEEGRRDETETALERFVADRASALPHPLMPFQSEELILTEASSRSLIRARGAEYSVPTTWARRAVSVHVGPDQVTIRRAGDPGMVVHPRRSRGRSVQYRHYLPELRRKPNAVRQCAGPLLAELGEPFGAAWRLLVDERGPVEASRAFAAILGVVVDRGEEIVAAALRASISRGEVSLSGVSATPETTPASAIPSALAAVVVEAPSLAAFDALLGGVQ